MNSSSVKYPIDNLAESKMTALPTGDWTYTEGDNINGRPIYRKAGNDYVMSVRGADTYSKDCNVYRQDSGVEWLVGTRPGSRSGFVFSKDSEAPECPHEVSAWKYYSQNTGTTEDDPFLTVACAAGKDK